MAISRVSEVTPLQADQAIERFLKDSEIDVWGVPPELRRLAVEAQERFGRGRHPAKLNFGDCLSYACAKHWDAALLFKGDDFAQTDVAVA